MEEGRMLKFKLGYTNLLQAVGRFCDEQQLDEICLVEFEKGIVLQGLKVESTSEGYMRHTITQTWSYEQIAGMGGQSGSSPTPAAGKRGGKR